MPLSQRDDQRATCIYEWIWCGDYAAARFARKRGRGSLDLLFVTHRRRRKLAAKHCCGPFEIAQEGGVIWRCLRVEHEPYPLDAGGDLLEHLQPFPEHREADE